VPVEKYVVGRAASATDGSVASMIGEPRAIDACRHLEAGGAAVAVGAEALVMISSCRSISISSLWMPRFQAKLSGGGGQQAVGVAQSTKTGGCLCQAITCAGSATAISNAASGCSIRSSTTSAGGLCRWRRGGRWQRSVERPCIQQLR
jgi:hypothetical protein